MDTRCRCATTSEIGPEAAAGKKKSKDPAVGKMHELRGASVLRTYLNLTMIRSPKHDEGPETTLAEKKLPLCPWTGRLGIVYAAAELPSWAQTGYFDKGNKAEMLPVLHLPHGFDMTSTEEDPLLC